MSNLTVTERNGILVVDSRLVAIELGIEHHTLLKTIDKYSARLEAKSPLRFEVDVVKRPQGGGSHTRYAWLDERQSTLLMTYSRNTQQVLNCKDALVDAFVKAKQLIPAQSQEIERLKLELQVAQAQATAAQSQERLMQVSSAIVTMHGAGMLGLILGKPEAIVEQPPIVVEKNILVDRSGRPVRTYEGLSKTKLARRYGMKKPQELVNWLQSMGKDHFIQPAMTAAPCQFVPFEYVPELDRLWAARQGSRQRILGE
ncbi:Rha family transcriptional regulator [Synechocystis sp. PCC 7509]|uniref:Rha family transcriptional regulator n=1 Tax=Synechocystis sp. PCC 7509 TaxID=927677 RepID=UPI000687956A|nr:Rha family transcriptional regulator [Synechocystis sp. PCC 7509]